MSKLKLIESKNFGVINCDFWKNEQGEIFLTREQIGSALEYSSPQKGIDNLHRRNSERLDKFSVTLGLRGTDGKDYGMSGQAMNRLLHELKVQYKQSNQWLLYREHQAKGYTHSETVEIVRSDGTPDIKMNTKWTQKGRLFLYELLKDNGVLPVIEKLEAA